MADLKTTYMGIELANPVVVGACSLSKNVDSIRKLEDAGAGALVIKSLFEEQIQIERRNLDDELGQHDDMFAEAVSLFPAVVPRSKPGLTSINGPDFEALGTGANSRTISCSMVSQTKSLALSGRTSLQSSSVAVLVDATM